jgi:hypothetical protein
MNSIRHYLCVLYNFDNYIQIIFLLASLLPILILLSGVGTCFHHVGVKIVVSCGCLGQNKSSPPVTSAVFLIAK